jgi:hypothetical protein
LKDTQEALRKSKAAADRAALASKQQVIILKTAQAKQVRACTPSSLFLNTIDHT